MPTEFKRHLSELELGDHLYLLYEDEDERLAGLAPALEEAFRRGHRCLYLAQEKAGRATLEALSGRGLDVESRLDDGSLELAPLGDLYEPDGAFEPDRLIRIAVDAVEAAEAAGSGGLWWVGEIPWHRRPEVDGEDVRAFETQLCDRLEDGRIVAICQFDRRRLSEEARAEVLRAHPLAVRGDEVYPNPFHLPLEAVLGEYGLSRTDWMLRQMEDARDRERRIHRTERRLRTLLHRAPDIIVRLDPELRYLYANPAIEKYVDVAAEEVVGRSLGELKSGGDALSSWGDGVLRALESGEEQRVEGTLPTTRGDRWFQTRIVPEPGPDGEPATVLLVARDLTDERRAREELEESARLFRKTVAGLREAVFIVEPEERMIVYCNPAAEEMFGRDRDELVGSSTRVVHADEESFRRFGEASGVALNRGETYRARFGARRADGTVFPTEHVVTLLHPEEGLEGGVVSVVRDVSEETEAREALELYARRLEALRELDRAMLGARTEEELLQAATARIRELLESWRVSVLLADPDHPGSHLIASRTAEEGSRIFQTRFDEGESRLLARLRSGEAYRVRDVDEDRDALVPEARALVDRGLRSCFAVPLTSRGRAVGSLNLGYDRTGAFSDITVELAREMAVHLGLALRQNRLREEVDRATERRREAERRAERLEVQLEALLDTLEVGVARVGREGIFLNVNEALADLLGYASSAELEGEDFRSVLLRPGRWDGLVEQLQGSGTVVEREFRVRRRDGGVLWVSGLGRRLESPDGTEVFEGIIRDITDRKRLEEQVLEISTQERRRIGRELHDHLGQQLTGIAFLARSLHGAADEASIGSVEKIETEARDAITRIRHLARGLEPGELGEQGLADALEELAEESRRLFDVAVTVDVDPEMRLGREEVLHLYRIVQEAMTNAVRHGGADRIVVRAGPSGEHRVLEVRDDGRGFQPSHDDDRGLGLRTMRYRCEALGGRLEVAGDDASGTVVRCRLPPGPDASPERGPLP